MTATAGASPSVDDFEPHVGVLIVHGIGTQSEGAELRQWVDSVVEYLEACPAAVDDASSPGILKPSDDKLVRVLTPPLGGSATADRQRWLIGEAWWAEAFHVPDRKEVSRWLVGVASWFLYLFFVRIWRRFRVDRWHIVAGLSFGSSLWLLVREAARDGSIGPVVVWVLVSAAAVVLTGSRPGKRLGAVVVAATMLLGYPLAAVATAAVVALWMVGLLPGRISERARGAQLALAQSVGDVYALIASPRQEQAMFDALSAAARRLGTSPHMDGKPLVLVAHSQGAALTYRALNKDNGLWNTLAGRRITLVTYGAGIVPIHVLEHRLRSQRRLWQWIQGVAGLVGPLLLAFSLARVAADGVDPLTRRVTEASLVLVAATFLATWRQEVRSRCKDDSVRITSAADGASPVDQDPERATATDGDGPPVCLRLRPRGAAHLRWVDLWAPWDPVPNGPLCVATPCSPSPCGPGSLAPPADAHEFVSCRVANLHQPWRDHVVYRDNPEDVVSRWVGEIAVRAKPSVAPQAVERPGRPGSTAAAAREWRRRRGRDLLLGQVLALSLCVVAIVKQWDRLDDLGRRAARELPLRSGVGGVVDAVPSGLRDGVFGATRDPAHLQGLVVALAAALAVIVAGTMVVSWWQRTATRHYLAGHSDTDMTVVGGLAASLVTAVGVAVFLGWAAARLEIDEVRTRVVRVHAASIVGTSQSNMASAHTEVRFEPLGTGDDTPVVVDVGDDVETVELDAGVEYRITAAAAAGTDCTASPTSTDGVTEVRVTCAASGTLLRRESCGQVNYPQDTLGPWRTCPG